MKNFIRVLFVLLSAMLAVPFVMAQEDATVTFTEADINATYRVTNPRRASISDVYVDLQAGIVEISATYTPRNSDAIDVAVQFTPVITDAGTVEWTLINIFRTDGGDLTTAMQTTIENLIGRSWESYWSGRTYRFDLTGVTVTDNEIIYRYVYTGERPPVEPTVAVTDGTLQVTYTENEVNEAYRVTNPRRATISDTYVDLQPGQVSISATYTPRRGEAVDTVTVLVPEINDNVLQWVIISVSANGQVVDDPTAINELIANSWIAYWKGRFSREHIQSVNITDDAITFIYQ